MVRVFSGLFIAEGSSDRPLATLMEDLFRDRGLAVRLTPPDFGQIREKVDKDTRSQLAAGIELLAGNTPDLVVIHRDADNAGSEARRDEISQAVRRVDPSLTFCPVIPVRMTEAWLLLDEHAIRCVAGKPRGRVDLGLPTLREVERLADPKRQLCESLLAAADETGRRRDRVAKRFDEHRRQLLESLDRHGPVSRLSSWQQLVSDVERVIACWR